MQNEPVNRKEPKSEVPQRYIKLQELFAKLKNIDNCKDCFDNIGMYKSEAQIAVSKRSQI